MRKYLTRNEFETFKITEINPFPALEVVITDEAATPMYRYLGGKWVSTVSLDASGNLVGPDGEAILNDFPFIGKNTLTMSAKPWLPWKSGTTFASTNVGGGTYAFETGNYYPRVATFSVTATANDYVQVNNTSLAVRTPQLEWNDLLIIPVQIDAYPTLTGTSATISVAVSSDNFVAKSGGFTGYILPSRVDGWHMAVVPVSTFTTGNTEAHNNTFNWVGVKILNGAGGGVCTIKVGGIWVLKPQRPALIIQFDDAFDSVYSQAYPLMAAAGLVGEIAVIANRVGTAGYCTEAQLLEMQAAGWSLVVHGNTDHTTLGSLSATQADIASNQAYVQSLGGDYVDYVYPAGIVAPSYSFTALRNLGFKTARTVYLVASAPEQHVSAVNAPLTIPSKPLNQTSTNAGILTYVDLAIAQGGLAILYGHKVVETVTDANNEISVTDFTTLVNEFAARCGSLNVGNELGAMSNMTTQTWRRKVGLI
jgi:hypothetical protein